MECQLTCWILSDISSSVRTLLQSHLTLNHRPYHQHQQQQNTTAFVCICKSKNGIGLHPTDCGWKECDVGFVPLQTSLVQLLNICCDSSDATARLTAAPRDAHARGTILSALQLVVTAGDLAAQTHFVTLTQTCLISKIMA